MSKIFEILNNEVHHEYTHQFKDLADARAHFAPNIILVEAPDEVFCGWMAYREGDSVRFERPIPPDGWVYDDATGTVYDPIMVREGERKALYEEYDGLESKYTARVMCGVDVEESTRKLRLIVAYKVAVGDTVNQPGFPNNVTYPEKPNLD